MEITKKNAKKIIAGMFVHNSKTVSGQHGAIKGIDGIVLFVTDKYVCVDTGQQVYDNVTVCQQNSVGQTVLTTEELKRVFARRDIINKGCRYLNWPEWEYWHWGDALNKKTNANGTPAEAIDMNHGVHGWPHQSRNQNGELLIPYAKVRFVKRIYF